MTYTRELILVADDDPDILRLVTLRLEVAGYRVATATNGEQALEIATALCPRLAVLDVQMPLMSGLEVLSTLRDGHSEMPVILLSASVSDAEIARGRAAGADDYIKKPFVASDLVAAVGAVISRSGTAESREACARS